VERTKPLILLVEDQSELRQMYAHQLVLSGFDVIEAGNGADACLAPAPTSLTSFSWT
jgi:CheY-like chemotaxis protein